MSEPDEARARWRAFADAQVAPQARRIDREECVPGEVVAALRAAGAFASGFPEAWGGPAGSARDPVAAALAHGAMHEALGAASASVQGMVNVHHMAGSALARWGTRAQKAALVPRLAAGDLVAALAITEPNVGSDARAVETRAVPSGAGWRLEGRKSWITCGQSADLFVLLAGTPEGPAAFLVPREAAGLAVAPTRGMLGCRGYALARLQLEDCVLPGDHLLGRPGFGLSHVAATGLDAGRHNLAWACVGLGQACLDASLAHARTRRQFDAPLAEFQLVQRMLARMLTDLSAARLLCRKAACSRGAGDPGAIQEGAMAKYFASRMANRVAGDALQIHGASGCGPDLPVERWFRDARIMEIIEGTSQVLEIAIARYGLQAHAAGGRAA
ncbi:putative acyl-CoA dehydrogenase fadE25 [Methylobacterium crusticola]|uniref:Acyl-CoA dehydrogenase fadE25 n=1 Tax=Methylobacterium crusticola TaxID=1697972 RepID=A0ABQ4R2M9_9HYPH|nr:acyl-CoA dehydrogenase family protein [Methylobacterium crusticola]GJD51399.1 putative acyl-CoA dehydrogenase fadE25 [Methylobacterium crusticola]